MIRETKVLFSLSSVGLFILAYFLFNDAILTASNNFPIFLEQVWEDEALPGAIVEAISSMKWRLL